MAPLTIKKTFSWNKFNPLFASCNHVNNKEDYLSDVKVDDYVNYMDLFLSKLNELSQSYNLSEVSLKTEKDEGELIKVFIINTPENINTDDLCSIWGEIISKMEEYSKYNSSLMKIFNEVNIRLV